MSRLIYQIIIFSIITSTSIYASPPLENCGAGYTNDLKSILDGVIVCEGLSDPFEDESMRKVYNGKCSEFNCAPGEYVFEIFINTPPPTNEQIRTDIVRDITCKNNLAKAVKEHAKFAKERRSSQFSPNCKLDNNWDLKVNRNIVDTNPDNIPRLASSEEAADCVYIATQVIHPGAPGCGSTPACIATVYCEGEGLIGTAMCDASNGQCPDVSICTDNSRPSPSWLAPLGGPSNTTINKQNLNRVINR